MTNQQLLDYIKQQLQQGVSNEDINKSLLANNWQNTDIEEAFNSITAPKQQNQSSDSPQAPKSKVLLIMIAIIGVMVISGAVIGYFVLVQDPQPTQEQTVTETTEKYETSVEDWKKYTDPQNRFSFLYPPNFGVPSQETDGGFGDNVATIIFSEFSYGLRAGKIVLGGGATLTKDFILVDIQALGGLYDPITVELFSEEELRNILENIPALTVKNFCDELAKASHIDLSKPSFSSFSQQQRDVIMNVDKMRNIDPKVISCVVSEDTVMFHKEATFESGLVKTRQNIYGAIRFLEPPFSSFQIVRVTADEPTQEMLSNITSVVKSFK
jgi:hypothetical protein